MNDICHLNNFNIDKISLLFCSKCGNLLEQNSKICQNIKCSKNFCLGCINDNKCPECKKNQLKNFSLKEITNIENLLFYCNKSIKCEGKYNYNDIINNHINKSHEIIKCNKCNEGLNQTANYLKCSKCQFFFCYKRLNYNPFFGKDNKNNIKDIKNCCGIKCSLCFKNICNLCNKQENNNKDNNELVVCSDCLQKNKNINTNEKKVCGICSKNNFYNKICSLCNINICLSCSNNCENIKCGNIICINCSLFCNICKKIICKKCSIKCSSCPNNISLISCTNCDSDTIIKCSLKNCNKKICLNCLKYCNYCKEINCDNHSLSCANCSETICPFHWHMCKKCTPKKLCLKNCTKKCHFCNYEINEFCKEENHMNNYIKKYPCGHYICNLCTKKCDICKEPIKACSECENDKNYVHCRVCNKYLCFYCSKKCTICNTHYCDESHKCFLCNGIINNEVCINCDFDERKKCKVCSKYLPQCERCSKIIICSYKCFNDNIIIKPNAKTNIKRVRTIQSIKSNITNNVINNVVNLFQKDKISMNKNNIKINNDKSMIETVKGEHLCLMYYCEEHLGNDPNEYDNNKDIDELNPGDEDKVKKYKRFTDKENVRCSSCIII